jgi:hypothetical protein
MIVSLYIIGSTAGLLIMAARLREARDELARMRYDRDADAQAAREEYGAYADGVAMALACLLAGLAAAHWYAPPRPADRPAGEGRHGARAGATPERGAAE